MVSIQAGAAPGRSAAKRNVIGVPDSHTATSAPRTASRSPGAATSSSRRPIRAAGAWPKAAAAAGEA